MTISYPASAQYPSTQASYQPAVSRLRHDVADLTSDLASGDLKGAQKSFADLQKLLQANGVLASSTAATTSSQPASAFSSTLQNDFQQLGQDLSTGNLAGARQDFSQLTSDAATAQQAAAPTGGTSATGGRHHRHHHHADSSSDSDSSTAQPTTLQNDFNQLGQDLSTGNFQALQKDFSQLTSDVGTSGSNSYFSFSYTSTTQTINFIG